MSSNLQSPTQKPISFRPQVSAFYPDPIHPNTHQSTHPLPPNYPLHSHSDSPILSRVPRIGRPESFEHGHYPNPPIHSTPQSHHSTPQKLQRRLPFSADSYIPTSQTCKLGAATPWRPRNTRFNSHHLQDSLIPQSVLDQPPWAAGEMRKYTAPEVSTNLRTQLHRRFSDVPSEGYTISPITGEIKRPRARKFPKDYWAPKKKEDLTRDWRKQEPQKPVEEKENSVGVGDSEMKNENPSGKKIQALLEEKEVEMSEKIEVTAKNPIDFSQHFKKPQNNKFLISAFVASVFLTLICVLLLVEDKQIGAAFCSVLVLIGSFYAMKLNMGNRGESEIESDLKSPTVNRTSSVQQVTFDKQKDYISKPEKSIESNPISPASNEKYESAAHQRIAASPSLRASESIVERCAARKEV